MPQPTGSATSSVATELVEERIICTNCVQHVGHVHIECAEEGCDKIPLCLQCFSYGAEVGPHKRGHNYRVKNTGGVPVFGPSSSPPSSVINVGSDAASTSNSANNECMWRYPWSSTEETTLLDMVERFNLGNWDYIASQVNPKRSPREVKEHYDKFYIRGRIGQITNVGYNRPKVIDHSESKQSTNVGLISPPIRQTVCKLHQDDLRLLAYMPHRDDFEKEWNNEAETTIAGLFLMPDDDELDQKVKLAQVDMYVRQVAERRKRKALARDYDLVPAFFKQERPNHGLKAWTYSHSQKKEMKLEREYGDKLKKFNQYLPSQEIEELIRGLVKEKMLKERIEELQKFRKNGIKTLEEGEKYVKARQEREASNHSNNNRDEGNLSSKHREPNDGVGRKGSVLTQGKEKPSVIGKESDDGRRSFRRPDKKAPLLSSEERRMCTECNLNVSDYVMLKLAVLREEVQKQRGIPMRTNLRHDTLESKAHVKAFLKSTGWLSPFST